MRTVLSYPAETAELGPHARTADIDEEWPTRSEQRTPVRSHTQSFESMPADRIRPSGMYATSVTHSVCPYFLVYRVRPLRPDLRSIV